MDYKERLIAGAEKLGIKLTAKQKEQFIDYLHLLQKWNQQINLTALEKQEKIVVKHFLDSLSFLTEIELEGTEKIIDIGTGAGFPGLPLKIVYPNLELTLLEAVKKKATFLRQTVYKLNLESVEVIHGRAEDYGQQKKYREQYDYGLARAVAELNILSEYTLPFVKVGGSFIAYKAKEVKKELENRQQFLNILGGQFRAVKEIKLPFSEAERKLVVIDKNSSTAVDYPRPAGKPSKQPLGN